LREQGRVGRPSEEVLRSVATALRLGPAEEDYLFQLARPWGSTEVAEPAAGIRGEITTMLDALQATPAFVINGRMDVIAANELATLLILDCASTPASRANAARMIFLDPVARSYYLDWDDVALEAVGHLRVAAARTPGDPDLARLLDELAASPRFPALWSRHEVVRKGHGAKRLRHPAVGELTVRYETLALPLDPDQTLVLYVIEPGSSTERALDRLTNARPA
jgi:MmyB-like transcription regulator ligand binding domain